MTANEPVFFPTAAAFRTWLKRNHAKEREIWVGLHKKHTGKPSVTWPEVVDEALCFGWIDGIRRSIDADAYANRVTPRRKGSNWSAVNIRRVAVLTAEGRMQPPGLAAFALRDEARSEVYSFDRPDEPTLDAAQLKAFRAKPKAWRFWESQPPGYRRIASHWVVSAKREETRANRFATLLKDSAAGLRIAMLRRDVPGPSRSRQG